MSKEKLVPSTFKLEEGNSTPFNRFMGELPEPVEFVDVVDEGPYSSWKNDYATVIFKDPKTTKSSVSDWMFFVGSMRSDEFDIRLVDGEKIIRMWWD